MQADVGAKGEENEKLPHFPRDASQKLQIPLNTISRVGASSPFTPKSRGDLFGICRQGIPAPSPVLTAGALPSPFILERSPPLPQHRSETGDTLKNGGESSLENLMEIKGTAHIPAFRFHLTPGDSSPLGLTDISFRFITRRL